MGLRIGSSTPLAAHRSILLQQARLSRNLAQLASGLRINSAADGPAGLAISEQLRANIGGATALLSNASRSINLTQTAEGALNEVNNQLNEIRSLTVQAGGAGILGDTGAQIIQQQIQNAVDSINRIAETAQFGGAPLLDGSFENVQFAIAEGGAVELTIPNVSAGQLGRDIGSPGGFASLAEIDVTTPEGAAAALQVIDAAINDISSARGELGAFQANTLETAARSLRIDRENLISAESTIRDADFSALVGESVLAQVRLQAGILAQGISNNHTGLILDLLA